MTTGARDRDRRRTMWLALLCALLVLGIAQLDEHRRFGRAQEAYMRQLATRAAASSAYLDRVSQFLSQPRETRGEMPSPPAEVAQHAPPEPRRERYMLIARIRQAVCFGAFAVAAGMPAVLLLSEPALARRNRRTIAEAMLALALFGTIGMMLGAGHLANWRSFGLGTNAAGYGLVLVPLGLVAVVLTSRDDGDGDVAAVDDAAGGGGSKM